MKKVKFLLLLLFCVSMFGINAQTSDRVNLSIILRPIQSITVNPSQKDVKLIYQTEVDYQNGVFNAQVDHLKVFSTGGFKINVKTNRDFTNGTDNILASDVTVVATPGTRAPNGVTYAPAKSLSTGGHGLLSSKIGGRDLNFNITYDNTTAGNNDEYINKNSGTYSAKVTYTIAPN